MAANLANFTPHLCNLRYKLKEIRNISIIGSGNVATHLAKALNNSGYSIDCVYSRKLQNASKLATQVGAKACDDLKQVPAKSDFFLMSVNDDSIEEVLSQLTFRDKLIAHTSGSVSSDVFQNLGFENYGVFYPLQTFSIDQEIDLSEVPFCIEGSSNPIQETLFTLASKISSNVSVVNSEQRKSLHIAAVFACNFTNHLYSIAEELLSKNGMSFDLLRPLILETALKAQKQSPASAQTGPAARKDLAVINAHLQMLAGSENLKHLYGLITGNIIKQKNGEEL